MNTRTTRRNDPKDAVIANLRKDLAQKTKELERAMTEVVCTRGLILEFEEVEETNETLEATVADLELKIAGLKMNIAALNHYVSVYEEKNAEQAQEIHDLKADRNRWKAIANQQRARLARHSTQRRAQRLAQRSAQPAHARVDPGSLEQPIDVSDSDSDTETDENMYVVPLLAPPLDREPRDRRRVRFDR